MHLVYFRVLGEESGIKSVSRQNVFTLVFKGGDIE